ncbi:MAG: hypothetical protein M3X11_21760 [Acidobacteriota bacterium]|nr:hypothetical protein [Acidobacteriota bacterium]
MESQQVINNRAETYWFIEPGYTTAQFSVKNFLFFTVTGQFTVPQSRQQSKPPA